MKLNKKRRGILISAICGAVGIIIIIVVAVLVFSGINYREAYLEAEEVKTALEKVDAGACAEVAKNLNSGQVANSAYEGYLNGCAKALKSGLREDVVELGSSAAVQKDAKIGTQYDIFYAEFEKSLLGDGGATRKLALFKAWHEFVVAKNSTILNASDADIATAAVALINSGDDALRNYADNWIAKRIAESRTYVTWTQTGYYSDYNAYNEAENALNVFEAENEPALIKTASENQPDWNKVVAEFEKLFGLISAKCK